MHGGSPGGRPLLAEDLLERPGTARANLCPVVVIKRYCSREDEIAKDLEGEEGADAKLTFQNQAHVFQALSCFDGFR